MKQFMNNEGEYGKYVIQDLILPAIHATPEAVADYHAMGRRRIHWVDGAVVPATFQLNTSWYLAPNREQQLNPQGETNTYTKWVPHVHDVDELLCFYGSDPDDQYNLNGEIEIIIGDESHVLTKSSLIFVPAGVPHTPPLVNRVDRPIFHFSMVLNPEYNFVTDEGEAFNAK